MVVGLVLATRCAVIKYQSRQCLQHYDRTYKGYILQTVQYRHMWWNAAAIGAITSHL